VVYGLKSKSEVMEYITENEAKVTSKFSVKISSFRCDNGTEFVNRDVESFFHEKGIMFELTVPGTPQLNGVAERLNRTILDKSRCLLLDSKLPKSFWIEAVLTAVYLMNRSPTRALKDGKVPAEKWFGRRPNLSHLKVFGCTAYLHVPKNLAGGKFQPRAVKCIFLGYTVNGYRLWNLERRRLVLGRNVVFNESNFLSEDVFPNGTEFGEGLSDSNSELGEIPPQSMDPHETIDGADGVTCNDVPEPIEIEETEEECITPPPKKLQASVIVKASQ